MECAEKAGNGQAKHYFNEPRNMCEILQFKNKKGDLLCQDCCDKCDLDD